MNKIRNVIIYYPSIENGGMEKNFFYLINHLANHYKINFSLIFIQIDSNIKKRLSKKIKLINIRSFNYSKYNRYLISLLSFSSYFQLLKKNFSNENTIIISPQNSIISIILSKILNYKIIVRNGNHPLGSLKYSDNYILSLFSFLLRMTVYNFADKIICNSKESRDFFKKFIFKNQKVITIENAINFSKKKEIHKRKKLIISAGRLTKQKNFETLIKGFEIFEKKNKDYKLMILGEGKNKKNLQLLTRKLNLQKKIIFKNYVNNPLDFISQSKLYVCSSLYEGLPSSLIEALSVKTPIISTNCKSGPSEILEKGKFGYLFECENYNQLGKLLTYAIKNYRISKKKILKGQSSIKKYNINLISKKYLREINKICNIDL